MKAAINSYYRPAQVEVSFPSEDGSEIKFQFFDPKPGHRRLLEDIVLRYNAEPMTEERAQNILAAALLLYRDGSLCVDVFRTAQRDDWVVAIADGCTANADELEALAWWLRNKVPT